MAMVKVVLLHNTRAGDSEYGPRRLAAILRRHGYAPRLLTLSRALKNRDELLSAEFVIAAGGDGTIKPVAQALARTGKPLAIIPLGTANNIAHSLGITGTPEKIIAGWRSGHLQSVDLGVAQGPWGRRYFIESLGVGLISRTIAVMREIGATGVMPLKTREERLYRDLCVFLALSYEIQPVKLRLRIGANAWTRDEFLLCEILNIYRSGPAVELSRSADATDGFLDLATVRASDRPHLQAVLKKGLSGKTTGSLLPTQKVQAVRLALGRSELRLDDDVVWPPAQTSKRRQISVSVSVAPGALVCLLPDFSQPKNTKRRTVESSK